MLECVVARAEAFSKVYPLTPGSEKLLESVLTGREQVVDLSHAMIERLKEEAARAGMQFLAVALIDSSVIRLYFRAPNGLFIKDVRRVSKDPSRDLFLDMIAYNFRPSDPRARPN